MGLIPTTGTEAAGQVFGTGLSILTGVPFLGSVFSGVFSSAFGGKGRLAYSNPNNWSFAPAPDITNREQAQAARRVFNQQFVAGGVRKDVIPNGAGGYTIVTSKMADPNATKRAAAHAKLIASPHYIELQQTKARLQAKRAAHDLKKQQKEDARQALVNHHHAVHGTTPPAT